MVMEGSPVDPKWLARNLARSWSRRAGLGDFTRQMLLLYAGALPKVLRRPCWTIGFRCPPPIGAIRLILRDNGGADRFVCSEVFEHECYGLPSACQPSTILDLGAHIGLAAIYFARSFPSARIACVEPVTDNLRLLRDNLEMNGVAAAVFAAAAHVEDGSVWMERATLSFGHKIASDAGPVAGELFEVAALSVPTLIERLGWERIGLVKIDIEGHEAALLSERSDWLHRVDAICLEYHLDGGRSHLTEIADRFGFLPPRVLPTGLWFLTR